MAEFDAQITQLNVDSAWRLNSARFLDKTRFLLRTDHIHEHAGHVRDVQMPRESESGCSPSSMPKKKIRPIKWQLLRCGAIVPPPCDPRSLLVNFAGPY